MHRHGALQHGGKIARLRQHRQLVRCKSTDNGAGCRWMTHDSDPVPSDLDAVLILAGGQRSDGKLHEWVRRRAEVGLAVKHTQGSAETPIVCLGGGTPHKPPVLRPSGFVLHEGTELADYLISQGLDKRHILKEASSYDTIGNGFFAATIHAVPAGWRRLGVVTSDFHMPRSRAIFETCFALVGTALFDDPDRFRLSFHAASDEGTCPPEVLAARKQREAASLEAWRRTAKQLGDLAALHAWLHSEHACYAVARQDEFGVSTGANEVGDVAIASY